MRPRNRFATILIYVAVLAATLSLAALRLRAQDEGGAQSAPPSSTPTGAAPNLFFSLSSHETYGTDKRARLGVEYEGVDYLDFRVYRLKDPVKFFKQLDNPHEMGEREKRTVAASYRQKPSTMERLRALKRSIYRSIKSYVRGQLQHASRQTFNQKFRGEGPRLPLNVADYARVPLLNPDQLVSSWRELLSPLDRYQQVALGQREPGVYLVEAVNGDLRAYTIAILTDLTMIYKTTPDGEVVVYAVDRKSGVPRPGAHVEIIQAKKTLAMGLTDRHGLLKTRIKKGPQLRGGQPPEAFVGDEGGRNAYLIMARARDHFAISDLESFYFGPSEGLTGYLYTDRPVYRPNQRVYFKGILRQLGEDGYRMVGERTVNVTIEDPNQGKLWEKDLPLSGHGTFSGELELASEAPLGDYTISARQGEATASGSFEVQEYKKPEYKVSITVPKKFVPVGETVKFAVEARYFFGSPVANAEVKYYLYRSRYFPWWWDEGDDFGEGAETEEEGGYGEYGNELLQESEARSPIPTPRAISGGEYGDELLQESEGMLDANGRLEIDFPVPPPDEKEPWDYSYRLEAQVTDSSRRTIGGSASFVGTRGNVMASLRPDRFVYYRGDRARIYISTTDYEGRPVAAKVTLKFIRQQWKKAGEYDYRLHERELASVDIRTNARGEAVYDYRVPVIGSIYIKPLIHEGEKQIVSHGGYLWAADRSNRWADFSYGGYGSIKLVPDKKSYRPGETAHVLAMLPTDRAHMLVTTERMQVLTARQIDAVGRAVMINVPIEARYAPNVYLNVAYVKDDRMHSSYSEGLLVVPARDKFLNLEIIPDKEEYRPRETATYTILARNADGTPAAGAEVSLGVVDEAVYSIRPERAPDIRKAFYGRRYNRVSTGFQPWYPFSGHAGNKPAELVRRKAANQLADFKNEGQLAEPMIRKEFKDTAHWQPGVITGADGKATLSVALPDNLTTWRATVRAVTQDTRVGASVGKVLARKDLILRLETPRFLTEGDTATISGIVHNYLPADKATQISLEVTGAQLLDPAEQTVTIARQGEHRLDWRIAASEMGEVRLLARALTDVESDAVEIPLPVVPVGLKQTRGGTMTLSEESAEKRFSLDLPAHAHAQARTLRIEASPSIAGTLFGALDYLTGYPYGCTEQTMSSFLPNVIVTQTLKEVRMASVRDAGNLGNKVQRGLDRLYGYQHEDGGWGWWKEDPTDPFMTAYVVDGLTMARRAGYAVEAWRIDQGRSKLQGMIDYLRVSQELSPDYTVEVYLNGEPVLTRRITSADAAAAQSFILERKGGAVGSANQVRVVKRGRGRLYLSTNLSYFTRGDTVAAQASPDLSLTREYLRLRVTENGAGELRLRGLLGSYSGSKWTVEPLAGELRSGDLIVSRLRVQGARAQYLMVEDPIPAGCQQIEYVSGLRLDYQEGQWSDWYSAREFRDQKTALFLNEFDGDATFQYALRVQVPGEFRVAPARAELMYQPTVQSNTATVRLKILEKGNGVKR